VLPLEGTFGSPVPTLVSGPPPKSIVPYNMPEMTISPSSETASAQEGRPEAECDEKRLALRIGALSLQEFAEFVLKERPVERLGIPEQRGRERTALVDGGANLGLDSSTRT
jgi:hypothetical protein